MKNTWMINLPVLKHPNRVLSEFAFFLFFLNHVNIFKFSILNFFFENSILLKFKNKLLRRQSYNYVLFYKKMPLIYENLRFKSQVEYPVHENDTYRNQKLLRPQIQVINQTQELRSEKHKKTNFLFLLFSMFTYSTFGSQFMVNYKFNLFGMISAKKGSVLLNFEKIFWRWSDSYDFLMNIYYYDLIALTFSSPLFRKEALALNWCYSTWDSQFWKYYSAFFILQPNKYHQKTNFFFVKLKNFDVSYYIVTDCSYHAKNLFYFRRNNYYTLGLVNVNNDPNLVSYPIISFFESYLTQNLFFKLLIYSKKKALFLKYNQYKQMWLNHLFKNFFTN